MPEETKKPEGFPDASKANEETVRKLEEQGRDLSKPAGAEDFNDASGALDKLLEAKQKPAEEISPTPSPTDDAVAKKAAADAEAAEKAKAERAEALKKSEDYFKDTPKLPTGASPKSSEAFESVKVKAAQEISAREQKIEELNKRIADYEEKLKNPIPPDVEKELSDHREWRAKLDVDADPKFKEFDKQVSQTQEFIYAQLRKSPAVTEALIEKIKSLGGPEKVRMDKLFAQINDPTLQQIVQSKVAEIEMAKFNKEEMIKAAKANITQYVTERQKQYEQATSQHTTATKTALGEYTSKLPWFAKKQIPQGAEAADKKAIEDHNAFIENLQHNIEVSLNDDSPQMRAILITGMANLLYLQPQHEAALSKIKDLEGKLKEATDMVARFKAGSTIRPKEGGALPAGGLQPAKTDEKKLFNTPATQALDDIAKQIMETRAAAGK